MLRRVGLGVLAIMLALHCLSFGFYGFYSFGASNGEHLEISKGGVRWRHVSVGVLDRGIEIQGGDPSWMRPLINEYRRGPGYYIPGGDFEIILPLWLMALPVVCVTAWGFSQKVVRARVNEDKKQGANQAGE